MGKTIIEKIIQAHTGDERRRERSSGSTSTSARPGISAARTSSRTTSASTATLPLADRRKTFFTFDLCAPACTLKYADNQQVCRDFARKYGVEVFDVDRGIGTHVLIEEGLAQPGTTVVGTDSHMNILGAVGSFGQGMGDVDITFAFRPARPGSRSQRPSRSS